MTRWLLTQARRRFLLVSRPSRLRRISSTLTSGNTRPRYTPSIQEAAHSRTSDTRFADQPATQLRSPGRSVKVIQAGRSYGRGRPGSDADQPGCCTLVLHCFRGFRTGVHRLGGTTGWPYRAQHAFQVCAAGSGTGHGVRDLGCPSSVMRAKRFRMPPRRAVSGLGGVIEYLTVRLDLRGSRS